MMPGTVIVRGVNARRASAHVSRGRGVREDGAGVVGCAGDAVTVGGCAGDPATDGGAAVAAARGSLGSSGRDHQLPTTQPSTASETIATATARFTGPPPSPDVTWLGRLSPGHVSGGRSPHKSAR
jgi:hypothetical protein